MESTQQRLLKNAERLMAENGITATSVREITDAAEANVASVNYYFGSKTELLFELLTSRFVQLDTALHAKIKSIEPEAGQNTPSVADLGGAYFDTLIEQAFDSETGRMHPFVSLIQRASSEQEAVLDRAQDLSLPGISMLIDLLADSIALSERKKLNFPILLDMMFGVTITAISVRSNETRNPVLISAVRGFLVAGAERYMSCIAIDKSE
ncbi:MAG: helix-turn-helix domain-containing protein [Roseibium sp.]